MNKKKKPVKGYPKTGFCDCKLLLVTYGLVWLQFLSKLCPNPFHS